MSEPRRVALPSLVSLLICDQVIDDKLTNKKSAIGIFNTIIVVGLPATINQVSILASLTEISSRVDLELRFVRDTDNMVLFNGRGSVDAPNPLAVVDLVFAMHGVRVPEAGQYAFEMLANGEILGRRRFMVILRPAQPPGPPAPPAPPTG